MRKHFVLVALLVFPLLLSPAFTGVGRAQAPASIGIKPGDTAPDFTLRDINGHPVTLSQFRGKVVVLNFWATWCPHCRDEIPSLERLNEVYGSSDFVLLTVNVEKDGAKTVKRFLKTNPCNFTILLDPKYTVQDLYRVSPIPVTFIINKKGRIVQRVLGAIDWSSVEALRYFSPLVNQ